MKSRLTPTQVTIESSFKAFTLEKGESVGSSVSITFAVPPDMEKGELGQAMLAEKEGLDVLVGTMELASGGLNRARYEDWKKRLREWYDRLLKREMQESVKTK